MARKIRNRRIV